LEIIADNSNSSLIALNNLRSEQLAMFALALSFLALSAGEAQASVNDFRLESVKPAAPDQSSNSNQPARTTNWLTRDGYPTQALREGREGTVHFTAHISSTGQIMSCEVTGSSGWRDLDEATCQQLKLHAHFTPATDEDGKPVEGDYRQSFRWIIPRD
jgi:TonB family protein